MVYPRKYAVKYVNTDSVRNQLIIFDLMINELASQTGGDVTRTPVHHRHPNFTSSGRADCGQHPSTAGVHHCHRHPDAVRPQHRLRRFLLHLHGYWRRLHLPRPCVHRSLLRCRCREWRQHRGRLLRHSWLHGRLLRHSWLLGRVLRRGQPLLRYFRLLRRQRGLLRPVPWWQWVLQATRKSVQIQGTPRKVGEIGSEKRATGPSAFASLFLLPLYALHSISYFWGYF